MFAAIALINLSTSIFLDKKCYLVTVTQKKLLCSLSILCCHVVDFSFQSKLLGNINSWRLSQPVVAFCSSRSDNNFEPHSFHLIFCSLLLLQYDCKELIILLLDYLLLLDSSFPGGPQEAWWYKGTGPSLKPIIKLLTILRNFLKYNLHSCLKYNYQ